MAVRLYIVSVFSIVIDAWKFCQNEKGLNVHGYVIMPNHLHAILSAEEGNLSDILRDFKRYTSRRISELLIETGNTKLPRYFNVVAKREGRGNDFKVWQTGSHPEALFSSEFFRQKLEYIHNNPVRKGFVELPEHWLFSSARNYALGDHSILHVDLIDLA